MSPICSLVEAGIESLGARYDLSFIEQSPRLVAAMARALGLGDRLERRRPRPEERGVRRTQPRRRVG